MARKSLYCLFLLILFSAAGLRAQQYVIGISYDTLNFPVPDSAAYGDTVSYNFSLVNNTAIAFSDTLHIMMRTQVGTFMLRDLGGQFIPAFGSQQFSITDTVSAQRYGGGVSVVVIWPTSPTSIIDADSAFGHVVILSSQGLPDEDPEAFGLSAYPNPNSGLVRLRQGNMSTRVTSTTLLNSLGQVILQYRELPEMLDLRDLPPGVYILELQASTSARMSLRLLKQ